MRIGFFGKGLGFVGVLASMVAEQSVSSDETCPITRELYPEYLAYQLCADGRGKFKNEPHLIGC